MLINEVIQISIKESQQIVENIGLRQLNSTLKKRQIKNRVNQINYFLKNLNSTPVCKITYSRLAYEKNNFRLTIDKDISFEPLTEINKTIKSKIELNADFEATLLNCQKLLKENGYILEIKHSDNIPIWVQNFLIEHQIEKESFSKYCYCMSFNFAERK